MISGRTEQRPAEASGPPGGGGDHDNTRGLGENISRIRRQMDTIRGPRSI